MQEQRLGHETGLSLPSCVSYNDGTTPSVTYSYDRRGRAVQIVRNSITTALTYSEGGQLLREGYTGGTLDGLSITNIYDSLLRRTNVSVKNGTSVLAGTGYGYDNASRLSAVTDGTNTATYTYVANSPLVGQIAFTQNGSNRMTTTKTYDALTRLSSIVNQPSADSAVSFAYQFNNANQRTRVTHADGSYWRYEYDALGQVTSGRKFWSDGTPVAGQQFDYTFDDIGNRKQTKAGGDQNGSGKRVASYSVNDLNQYTQHDVPGGFDVLGVARGTVTVNGNSTYRKGEYFRNEVSVSNGSAPQYQSVNVTATDGSSVSDSGNVFVAKTPEVFGYDLDGNMTNDGRWALTWDAENRLIKQQSLTGAPVNSSNRLTFDYDHQGRRIQKVSEVFTNGAWATTLDHRFVYDGWNLLAAVDNANALQASWWWGTDLSGSLQGAGGVGGLLSISTVGSGTHFAGYDGNGNVAVLVSASSGTASAHYEYDPFGRVLRSSGALAALNPFRFSTKFTDGESEFNYYGYRSYNPVLGKWLNRDPIEEAGGLNLYAFVGNDPIQRFDLLGLDARSDCYKTCQDKFGSSGVGGARAYAACIEDCKKNHPPDPTGFALCIRDVNPEGLVEHGMLIGFRILHPLTPTDHAYLHYKRCNDCEKVGWGIGGTKPGAPPILETKFNPTDCKPCKKTDSLLQYGAPGRKGTEATDSEILDCISEVPTSKNYKATGKGQYNCMNWAKEAASKCGLDCN